MKEVTDTTFHVFLHQKKTGWIGFVKEVAQAGRGGQTETEVRREVYEALSRHTGEVEPLVVEETVRRGRYNTQTGVFTNG